MAAPPGTHRAPVAALATHAADGLRAQASIAAPRPPAPTPLRWRVAHNLRQASESARPACNEGLAHDVQKNPVRLQPPMPTVRNHHQRHHPAIAATRPFNEATPAAASRAVENNEIGERIASAVAELPEDQRTAFVLAEYHGKSYAEMAEIMGCSEKSVESRLYRAKQSLRTRLVDLIE